MTDQVKVGDFVKVQDLCVRGFVKRLGALKFGREWLPAAILDTGGGREEVCPLSNLTVLFSAEQLSEVVS